MSNRPTLAGLRAANLARLPLFKNCHGDPAHSEPDGSDWTPAQWLQAFTGELGELAEAIMVGTFTAVENELADCQIYLDLLMYRILPQNLKGLTLHDICVTRFPFVAREVESEGWFWLAETRALKRMFNSHLGEAQASSEGAIYGYPTMLCLQAFTGKYANLRKKLERGDVDEKEFYLQSLKYLALIQLALSLEARELGVDLALATQKKFNATSRKMEVEVFL